MSYYPLLLNAISIEKIWGGRNLEKLFAKNLPPNQLIGETWEAWEGCEIANGNYAGQQLERVVERDPVGFLGTRDKRFPLLFKFIDAQKDLSVQVHPDDRAAQKLENYPFGKTEAWYILAAEPNAHLFVGFQRDTTSAQIRAAIANQSLVDLLQPVPVQRGDVVFVPAGTVHAIGKGIVLAEIQENSDITYRLYDWSRRDADRELHIEQSLRVAHLTAFGAAKILPLAIKTDRGTRRFLVACRYFALELIDLQDVFRGATSGKFQIISAIQGAVEIRYGKDRVLLQLGRTAILPAALEKFELAPVVDRAIILRAYVPNLRTDVIAPLKKAGYAREEIARLGGSMIAQKAKS